MPALRNPRNEHFACLVASGEAPTRAYVLAGYSPNGAGASSLRLLRNDQVCARIAELKSEIAERSNAPVDRAWVLGKLKTVVERCMQAEPACDAMGTETGVFQFQASDANRALELLGRELGMFRDQSDHLLSTPVETFKRDGEISKLDANQVSEFDAGPQADRLQA
jgi:phage terminase small subunit